MLISDWIVLAICLGLLWPKPALGETVLTIIRRKFSQFAGHKSASIVAVGAATIAIRVALLPWMPVPEPKVHDEFANLLASDTFAHGRLANPAHPMWMYFDTFHVIQHPTYASMYPPAQGAVLALGQVLGNPWIGVLLSTAAMCMAMTWMLQGWMEPEWALLGGLLVLFRVGIFSYWMNSYWGGAVAATGAALALGALPRIDLRRPRDGILLAVGVGILANSRPAEGLIFFVPIAVALAWWTFRLEPSPRLVFGKRVLLPCVALLACFFGFIGFYNWRVTHDPFLLPHLIEDRQYITTPIFIWQRDKPAIQYPNPQFEDFYTNFMPSLYRPSWANAKGQFAWRSTYFWQFFLGPLVIPLILPVPWLARQRRTQFLLIQFSICCAGLFSVAWFFPHYAAPAFATVVVLVMLGLRHVSHWQIGGRPVGEALTTLVVLYSLCIGPTYVAHIIAVQSNAAQSNWRFDWLSSHYLFVLLGTVLALALLEIGFSRAPLFSNRSSRVISTFEFALLVAIVIQVCIGQRNLHPDDYAFVDDLDEPFRGPVEQKLAAMPGNHLVLVQYASAHDSGEEYVYNSADIDHARTVWAREIPGMDLRPLLDYFHDRDVWVFSPDRDDENVVPYSPEDKPTN